MTDPSDRPASPAEPVSADEFATAFGRLIAPGEAVLVAASGGPDSTALLGALTRWRGAAARSLVIAATVNHGLRAASAEEAVAVGSFATALGLTHRTASWTPPAGTASQEAARGARYALLSGLARQFGITTIATGHHGDDQAETLLMRLAAGSGLSGLAGIRPVSRRDDIRLVRPLLALPKARLVATCRAEGWPFAEDPTNADPHHARPRWRALAPALAAEGLTSDRLGRLADRLARADAALDATAGRVFVDAVLARTEGRLDFDGRVLASEPAEIGLRVLARALLDVPPRAGVAGAGEPRLARLERCFALLGAAERRPIRVTLAGRLVATDGTGRISVTTEPSRRRGAFTEIAAGAPHSLGTTEAGA